MTSGLAARDLRALLGFGDALQSVERLPQLPEILLPALLKLVDADLAGWNDIDLTTTTFDGYLFPDPSQAVVLRALSRLADEPPLLVHFRKHSTVQATRISDVCDRRAWHAHPTYVEVYRRFGIERQIGLPVTATPTRIGAVAMNRDRQDFSDRDRDVLSAAHHIIEGSHRRLVRASAREEAVGALGADAGWIAIDPDGVVADFGQVAHELAQRCSVALEHGRRLPVMPPDLTVRWLEARSWRGDGGLSLLAIGPSAEPAGLGLTRRQYEALCAVADGATVRVAARRLDVSPPTLATHLRDAHAALGVSSRVAALNLLRRHGLLPDRPQRPDTAPSV